MSKHTRGPASTSRKTNHNKIVVRFRLSFFLHLTDSQPQCPSHFPDSPTRTLSTMDLTAATDLTMATDLTTAMDSTTVANSIMATDSITATDSTMKRRAQCQREGFGNGRTTPAHMPQPLKPNECGPSVTRAGRRTHKEIT